MSKIKPCPFCGSKNVSPNTDTDGRWVECGFCGARGPKVLFSKAEYDYPIGKNGDISTASLNEAIRRWNLAKR